MKATVEGTVLNALINEPLRKVHVILFGVHRYTAMTGGGSVTFKNLAPGEYRIAAFPKMDPDYAYLKEFRSRFNAQKMIVREGSNEAVEVKLIPKSAIEAEVAKLR